MSWGKGIILVFAVFMLGIGVMVYKSMTKNIDLVSNNYYEKELKYQEQINKINNTRTLKEGLKIVSTGSEVIITYPSDKNSIKGEISFYKPSDAGNDFKASVEPGSDMRQIFNTQKLTKGLWKVQINWAMDGKDYFNEEKVMIQ
ncbi:MAG: FixH family protein [Ignavibacteria bacterium]